MSSQDALEMVGIVAGVIGYGTLLCGLLSISLTVGLVGGGVILFVLGLVLIIAANRSSQ